MESKGASLPKPNTVLLSCKQFAALPTEVQVAEWFGNHLFTGEAADILGRVGGLDIEEREKRIMVQLGSEQDVDTLLTRMGEEGVAWPEFLDPVTNAAIKIRGFSADRSALRVTLLDVPRDVEDDTVRGVMALYGKVEEVRRHHLTKPGMEHILANRVSVKLVKDRQTELPTTIFGLGSATSGEERSIWRVTCPGATQRCYRCGHANHKARDCRKPGITMQQVEKLPAVGEVQPEVEQQQQPFPSFPRSFAAVVKSAKFVEKEAEETREQDRLKHEKMAKKVLEERRKPDEKADRDAAKEASEAVKNVETEQKRAAKFARLAEASQKAADYKEQVKHLAEQAKKELQESREYEKELEDITTSSQPEEGPDTEVGRKRSASPSQGDAMAKKPSTNPQNGRPNL